MKLDPIQTYQRGGGNIAGEWQKKEITIGKTNNRKMGTHSHLYAKT